MRNRITGLQIAQRKWRWVAKQMRNPNHYVISLFIGNKEIMVGQFADNADYSLVTDLPGVYLICGGKKHVTVVPWNGEPVV